jgi:pyruvate/2-oxoglutarate dehydrogenase complex dihydrolipoamide acyltransferase (E2) component
MIKKTCLIGGSDGVAKPLGPELGFVLEGEVLDDGALTYMVAGEAVSSSAALGKLGEGLASASDDGAGGVLGALVGGATAFVRGETATMIGATAALCPSGLTAEPTMTPNASSAITATPASAGERPASAPAAPVAAAASPSGSPSWSGSPVPSGGAVPISFAVARGSGPRRAPHSTQ